MPTDSALLRRRLASAFVTEAFRLTLRPPPWTQLSEEQVNEYLGNSILCLRAELMFQKEWAAHHEEEKSDTAVSA